MEDAVYSVVDVETTGLRTRDRVVEIAIRRVDSQGRAVSTFESVLDPGRDPGPTWLHGLTSEQCRRAPRFCDVAGEIHRLLVGTVLVAHHLRFDWAFLRREFARCKVTFLREPAGVCTAQAARAYGLRGDLDRAATAMGLVRRRPHGAGPDAEATHELWQALRRAGASLGAGMPVDRGCGAHRLPLGAVGCSRTSLTDQSGS